MTVEEILARPICPVVWVNNHKDGQITVHCDPECAWYDADRNQCAILSIAKDTHKAVTRK